MADVVGERWIGMVDQRVFEFCSGSFHLHRLMYSTFLKTAVTSPEEPQFRIGPETSVLHPSP